MAHNYIDELLAVLNSTGLSQVALAKELGVTFAALNRWLNGHAIPRPTMIAAIHRLHKERVGLFPLAAGELARVLAATSKQKKRFGRFGKLLRNNQRLQDDLLLELTYNSNAIEGSTLTKKETEAIIFDKATIKDRSYIEQLEATNHAAALSSIFAGDFAGPITETKIKELHRVILQGIRSDAGKYSRHHRAIRGVDLRLPAPADIPEEMAHLVKQINRSVRSVIKHVAQMHAEFEAIHPFGDGNGRVGRLIMIVQLLHAGYAPCVIENSRKAEYYEVLEFAQKRSDNHLIKFVAEAVLHGYYIAGKHLP